MKFVKMGRRKTAENSQSSSSSSYCMKLRSSSSSRVVEKQQNIPAPVLNNSNDHHKKKRENQHAGQSTTPKRICTRQSREKPHAQLDNVPEIDPVEPVIQVEENERIARMLQENKNKGKEQSRENPSGRHVKHPETALVEIVRQFEEDEAMARRLQAQLEVEGNVNSSILRREDSRSFSSQDDEEEDVSDGEEDVSEVEEDVSDGDGDEDEYDDHFEEVDDDDCLLRMEDFFSSHDDEEEDVSDGYDDEDEYDAQFEVDDDNSSLLRMDSSSISSLDDEEENVSFGFDDEDEYDDEEVSEGLPETELNRFPVTKYVQRPISASCAVCLSDYKDGDDLRTLPCTHTFHKCCVDKWLMRKASCPVCRLTVRITV